MQKVRVLKYGMLYINKYNIDIMVQHARNHQLTYNITEVFTENWNDDCSMLRFSSYSNKALQDFSAFLHGSVQMLLLSQAKGKVNKGE